MEYYFRTLNRKVKNPISKTMTMVKTMVKIVVTKEQ